LRTSSPEEFFISVAEVFSWVEPEEALPEEELPEEVLPEEAPLISEAILFRVFAPAIPSALRLLARWKLYTASSVSLPKLPVTEPV